MLVIVFSLIFNLFIVKADFFDEIFQLSSLLKFSQNLYLYLFIQNLLSLQGSGLNAQKLLNCHLDNVIGIVVHIPNKVFSIDNVQKYNGYLRNIYVIELDQMENGNKML